MNYAEQLELLRKYRVQSPIKYKRKFGDVLPEEAANKISPNPNVSSGPVKVEFRPAPEVKTAQIQFTEPEVTYIAKPEVVKEEPKKRGRKKNG